MDRQFRKSLIAATAGHALLLSGLRVLASASAHAQPKLIYPELVVVRVAAKPDPMHASAPAPVPDPAPAPARPRPPARAPRPVRQAVPPPAQTPAAPPTEAAAPVPGPAPVPVPASHGDSIVARPRYRDNPKPDYPTPSLRRREEGVVLLNVEVDADGRSGDIALKQTSGHALLDEAAIRAVGRWTFEPARVDGRAVASRVVVPVRFSLTNP
ncbi:MAG TPA: energy transducer TonB [Haliangiales bacterium]|nr:energy transducer TonB [Haliangiales bacterium]